MKAAKTTSMTQIVMRFALATVLVLMVPLVAMQFTEEMDWALLDFIVMGTLLFSAGLAFEIAARMTGNRILTGIVVGIMTLLIWAELAVGIFGTPIAGS